MTRAISVKHNLRFHPVDRSGAEVGAGASPASLAAGDLGDPRARG
jgi:hypothetical protein